VVVAVALAVIAAVAAVTAAIAAAVALVVVAAAVRDVALSHVGNHPHSAQCLIFAVLIAEIAPPF
jgi:hypothetical protein